jgi:hypothetical protein
VVARARWSWGRYALGVFAVFAAYSELGALVHGHLLRADYQALGPMLRPVPSLTFIRLSNLFFSLAFVWVYAKGAEAGPWPGQGLRFGLAAWLLVPVPVFLINHALYVHPGTLIAKQIACELFEMLALGLLAGWLHAARAPSWLAWDEAEHARRSA